MAPPDGIAQWLCLQKMAGCPAMEGRLNPENAPTCQFARWTVLGVTGTNGRTARPPAAPVLRAGRDFDRPSKQMAANNATALRTWKLLASCLIAR